MTRVVEILRWLAHERQNPGRYNGYCWISVDARIQSIGICDTHLILPERNAAGYLDYQIVQN